MIKVGILMGSESDRPVMEEAVKILTKFDVECELIVASAHRTPEKVQEYVKNARANGIEVLIAGAGMAAHLAGAVAAHTTLPVIGVPIDSSPLNGMDSLLSTVQMPPGIPVGSMAIGKAGAKNSAYYALSILSISDPEIAKKLEAFRQGFKS